MLTSQKRDDMTSYFIWYLKGLNTVKSVSVLKRKMCTAEITVSLRKVTNRAHWFLVLTFTKRYFWMSWIFEIEQQGTKKYHLCCGGSSIHTNYTESGQGEGPGIRTEIDGYTLHRDRDWKRDWGLMGSAGGFLTYFSTPYPIPCAGHRPSPVQCVRAISSSWKTWNWENMDSALNPPLLFYACEPKCHYVFQFMIDFFFMITISFDICCQRSLHVKYHQLMDV